ncbi:hypothetical protein I302_106611 [Kwoniella bestiolae CBS 10118]|uniref:Uncharacterized protein n=1 Tax=Kwoniella bestiolae CBS 10118 TaxID=1296100 RepID=A0A1B9G0X5_9TREE|nr:hypothetical protein I302_06127 [Kwoniella bestiolae CBS 10118]OCF24666.1 hypothetical protein I302_06127 [Kwoniella bestiolae CBS 10118]
MPIHFYHSSAGASSTTPDAQDTKVYHEVPAGRVHANSEKTVVSSQETDASYNGPEGRVHVNHQKPVIKPTGSVYVPSDPAHEAMKERLADRWGNSSSDDALAMAAELANTGESFGTIIYTGDDTYNPRGECDGILTYNEENGLQFRGTSFWPSNPYSQIPVIISDPTFRADAQDM